MSKTIVPPSYFREVLVDFPLQRLLSDSEAASVAYVFRDNYLGRVTSIILNVFCFQKASVFDFFREAMLGEGFDVRAKTDFKLLWQRDLLIDPASFSDLQMKLARVARRLNHSFNDELLKEVSMPVLHSIDCSLKSIVGPPMHFDSTISSNSRHSNFALSLASTIQIDLNLPSPASDCVDRRALQNYTAVLQFLLPLWTLCFVANHLWRMTTRRFSQFVEIGTDQSIKTVRREISTLLYLHVKICSSFWAHYMHLVTKLCVDPLEKINAKSTNFSAIHSGHSFVALSLVKSFKFYDSEVISFIGSSFDAMAFLFDVLQESKFEFKRLSLVLAKFVQSREIFVRLEKKLQSFRNSQAILTHLTDFYSFVCDSLCDQLGKRVSCALESN
jgi:hypothetical protein